MGEENIHLISLGKAEFSYGVIFRYDQGDNKEKQIHYSVDYSLCSLRETQSTYPIQS
ncbi:hypothetical protein [Apibacter adventoris]|uniref:hypothetical protein n=1 Tax=Apibacter adventoris TaxID=1679466 RepID=UPI0015E2E904|nr:hypothetical protein [Apibacter adventoris]